MLGKMSNEQLRARVVFLMAGMTSADLLDVAMHAEKVGLYARSEVHAPLVSPSPTSRVRRTNTSDRDRLDLGFDGRAARTIAAKT